MKYLIIFTLLLHLSCADVKDDVSVTSETNGDEVLDEVIEESTISSPKEYKEYHENGQLKIEGINNADGLRTGIWTSYYPDGKKWSESHYILGLKEGHSVTFYENGNIRYIGEYKNDKQTGEWTFYDEEGNEIERKIFE
jgi:antitoxin component YwqK of YwqJK toxin-antitoxin module